MTRPLRLAAAVAVLGLTCLAPAVAAARDAGTTGATGHTVGAGVRPARADESLQILDQDFTIEVDTPFAITLTLPVDVDPADFDADAVVVVTSHRSVVDRAEMHQTLDGELTRTEDTFDVSLDPAAADPNLVVVDADTISLRIPTESQSRTPAALQLAQTGVHPIVVELRIGDRPAGEVTTFLNRLPSVTGTAGPLSVSFVMRQMSLPTIEADGTVSVSDSAHAELAQLRDVLAALDAAPAAAAVDATVPRGVLVEPAVVQALGASDAALAEELLLGLANSDLIATPRLPLDPSAAVRAGQQDRYGQWLLEGEDLLGAIAPIPAIDRSVALVDDRLSRDGAELQRTLGTRMLVLPYDFYTELDGSLLEFTDISQLVTVGLADGTEIPAAIVDDFLGNQMVSGAARPLLTAVEIAAELVVLARDLDIDGAVVDRHGVVLALPDMGIPDPTLMGDLARLLLDTPSTRLVEPRELATTTDLLLNDGRPVMVELPDEAGPDLSSRLEALDDVAADVLAYASMLPSDSPDIARWTQTLDAFPSTAMSDAQVEAAIAQLNDDFERYRSAIIAPEPFSFTLTGRDNLLRFELTNTSDTPLRVRVSLGSPKIRFPDGDLEVELAPGTETNLVVNAQALSNGKSSVFLRVYTPGSNRSIQLVPEVVLTARVTSLAGLGQLITGAGMLLVLTWWAHHARTTRRSVAAAKHQSRHPAARRESAPVPDGEVSPDAAASSLPPS